MMKNKSGNESVMDKGDTKNIVIGGNTSGALIDMSLYDH